MSSATPIIPFICALTHVHISQPFRASSISLASDLLGARSLAVRAVHLLRTRTYLARLLLNLADDFLGGAFNLVLYAGLVFVVGSWSALFCNPGSGARLGSVGLGPLGGRGGALARGFGGDGSDDSRPGVAGCAGGRGHCRVGWLR